MNHNIYQNLIISCSFICIWLAQTVISQDKTTNISDAYSLELFKSHLQKAAAETDCHKRGGWLVRIKDQDMRNTVSELKSGIDYDNPNDNYYIGLEYTGSKWLWNDGTELTQDQKNWARGEGSASTNQNCSGVFHEGNKWFDAGCGEIRRYICQIDLLLTITADRDDIISLGNETFIVELIITRRGDEKIDIEVFKESNSVEVLSDVTNTISYTIKIVNKEDAGMYTFVAKPNNERYSKSVGVNIIVHVPVSITSTNPTTISSPVTTGANLVTCISSGIPTPETIWQRYGVAVTSEKGNGVYQNNTGMNNAILHIGNAELADQGNYTCNATNYIGEYSKKISQEKDIFLAVYGPPNITETQVKECSIKGKVVVKWEPNIQTMKINHRLL